MPSADSNPKSSIPANAKPALDNLNTAVDVLLDPGNFYPADGRLQTVQKNEGPKPIAGGLIAQYIKLIYHIPESNHQHEVSQNDQLIRRLLELTGHHTVLGSSLMLKITTG